MGLISSSIPNLVNGISQQPFTLRMASQGEVQENGLSTVAQGLKKRSPTKHIAKLSDTKLNADGAFIHIINRDETERYIVIVTQGDLKVFDKAGNQKTVTFPNGKAYLSAASPRSNFRAVSIADYTFIVNRTVKVLEDVGNTVQAARGFEALINVKAGNYGKTYVVNVNGRTVASYTTPNGGSASDTSYISTDHIAEQLREQLVTSLGGSDFTVDRAGSVVWLKHATADFTLSCNDGFNGNAMTTIKQKLQRFSDLPNRSPIGGFVVEITGDANSTFDNYWVKYDNSAGVSTGVWKETCKPGLSAGVVASTMPWALIRQADGTFVFKPLDWDKRKVGDIKSNPNLSFMGRTLNDVLFYRNRLGFLCDENLIFSEAGSYFNFFRTTATQLLDSEPIDVAVNSTRISILEHALPFNKQLLIFSGQSQFILDQNDLLSPKTISVKQSTDFPCDTRCKPIGVGKNVYFVVDKGDWSALREYYADFNNLSNDSLDVTGHVPRYIPSGVFKITVSTNEDIMCLLSSKEPNSLFVYKYFWSNNEKIQSAWSKWVFPAGNQILNAEFLQSELLLVVNRDDGVFIEKMSLSLGYSEANEPFQILLDRKRTIPKTSLTLDGNKTRFTETLTNQPWETLWAVTALGGSKQAGVLLQVKSDATGLYVTGDYTGTDLIVGREYNLKYQLSTITVKAAAPGGGQKSDTEGRLQIRKVAFNYADTGFFDVKVTPHNRNTYQYRYAGKTLGNENATIGQPSFDTGRFVVPVVSRNIDTAIVIENNSPIPCSILSADWEGFYVKRSQAI